MKIFIRLFARSFLALVLLSSSFGVVADEALSLLGEGQRKKAFITLYDAALYTQAGLHGQAGVAIAEADARMKIVLTLRSKLLTAERMAKALRDGFERSMDGDTTALSAQIEGLVSSIQANSVSVGDVVELEYRASPDSVTQARKNGELLFETPGLAFKLALFGIWLSDDPVQASLKRALTGG